VGFVKACVTFIKSVYTNTTGFIREIFGFLQKPWILCIITGPTYMLLSSSLQEAAGLGFAPSVLPAWIVKNWNTGLLAVG
jgi:hypothetical protein